MIEYKKISISDKDKLDYLIKNVINNLERKEFFIPFDSVKLNNMFNEDKIIVYGAYDNDILVGMATLYIDNSYFNNLLEIINIESDKIAELGGYLVLSDYRNKGIMKHLQNLLIEEAKKLNYEYIILTVHPENIPSNKVVSKIGAEIVKTSTLGDYLRNIYLLEI